MGATLSAWLQFLEAHAHATFLGASTGAVSARKHFLFMSVTAVMVGRRGGKEGWVKGGRD